MKRILLLLLLMSATVIADTTKVVYIITSADTTTRNANVDSIRYDIVNDPQNQLPGIWKVDLCRMADAEGKNAAYWAYYDLIITWGGEETQYADGAPYLDGILDTIRKPVICRDAYVARGDPMFLGTAALSSEVYYMKVPNKTHFITRHTYTDNANYGDSVALYTSVNRAAHSIRGMANDVTTLIKWPGDLVAGDADTAMVAVLDSAGTNASGGTANNRRAYFGLITSWQYCSWEARDLWFRTLRWAIADTVIDTCVTKIQISREGIDGNWMEYSGLVCQMHRHYGGYGTLYSGYRYQDRVAMVRARTTAITTKLPDTSATLAYDIVGAQLVMKIQAIEEEVPANPFSFWEGIWHLNYDTLWYDAKANIYTDSTCAGYVSGENHEVPNSQYLKYPTIPWDSDRASTRGTDYFSTPYDSIWVQDPLPDNYLIWSNLDTAFEQWRDDSLTNQGIITHTMGTTTGQVELKLYSENANGNAPALRSGPMFIATLVWREANTAEGGAAMSIDFNPDSVVFTAYENGADPDNQILQVYNGSSDTVFTCGTTAESPAVDWLAIQTNIGGGETPFYLSLNPTIDGLADGYYFTYIKNTCATVSDSPDSAKVILQVNPVATRPTDGKFKW